MPNMWGACQYKKMMLDPFELKLQAVLSYLLCILRTEIGCSEYAVNTLNY